MHDAFAPAPPQLQSSPARCPGSLDISLMTGGQDRHYAVGLGTALIEQHLTLDVIGSDEIDGPEFHRYPCIQFHNLHGTHQKATHIRKLVTILAFYVRLFRYAFTARPRLFHILWNNRLPIVDRTILMLLYKMAGKKIVLTAHNVNAGSRDETDSWLNRTTLRCQYKLADHLFVHTKKMKDELIEEFDVVPHKVTVIPYGINNAVPVTTLTREEARRKLGLHIDEKVLLYFGAIKKYKGLEILVIAFQRIAAQGNYRLVIAGERKKEYEVYWRSIKHRIDCDPSRKKVLQKIEFIPDAETETYFKAADVAVLPYTAIFQSGILFLSYTYGLPVIATDVGSFSEDIVEGRTGFICKPRDPDNLATTIRRYFETDLYRELEYRRQDIRDYVLSQHSWNIVAKLTKDVYLRLLDNAS